MTLTVTDNLVSVQEVDDIVTVTTSNTVVPSAPTPLATPTVSGTVKTDVLAVDPLVYLKASVDALFAWVGVANIFTLGPNLFKAGADGNVALAARRHSSGATGNIFEAQNESGTALSYIDSVGRTLITGKLVAGRSVPSFALTPPATWLSYTPTYTVGVGDTGSVTDRPTNALDLTADIAIYNTYAPTITQSGVAIGLHTGLTIAGIAAMGSIYAYTSEVYKTTNTAATDLRGNYSVVSNIGGGSVTQAEVFYANLTCSTTAGGSIGTAYGMQMELVIGASNSVTTLYGYSVRPQLASGSTITTLAAFRGRMTSVNASAAITNAYGLWIDKMVGGSTIQRAILTDGGTVQHQTGTANIIGLIVNGFTSQSANLQEWQSSASAIYGTVSENGYFTTRKIAAPVDAELATSELAFWFDAAAGAAKLKIKAKNASGTVVNGEVALT